MNRTRCRGAGVGARLLLLALVAQATPAAPPPVAVQSAPGRFEIAAMDASLAHAVAAQAEDAWRFLAGPLTLPDSFSTPVFVRIVPRSDDDDDRNPAFRVVVEPGGVVSLRLRLADTPLSIVRRSLVQALLIRLAVTRHGVTDRLTAPLWLEQACVGWWQTRADGAQLDALKQETARIAPPPLDALLGWRRGVEPRALEAASVWLLTFLQSESGRGREWPVFLQQLLGGDDPESALAASFPGRFRSAEERELWWQTGWHHVRRARSLPALDAAESRVQLGALARFVFAAATEDADAIVPLPQVLARSAEPIVATELARRAAEAGRLIAALHPFYRNAGLALAEAFRDAGLKNAARRAALVAAFEQDWRDAIELESATNAALDALESGARYP